MASNRAVKHRTTDEGVVERALQGAVRRGHQHLAHVPRSRTARRRGHHRRDRRRPPVGLHVRRRRRPGAVPRACRRRRPEHRRLPGRPAPRHVLVTPAHHHHRRPGRRRQEHRRQGGCQAARARVPRHRSDVPCRHVRGACAGASRSPMTTPSPTLARQLDLTVDEHDGRRRRRRRHRRHPQPRGDRRRQRDRRQHAGARGAANPPTAMGHRPRRRRHRGSRHRHGGLPRGRR